ncbi:MAG: hypothetical protein PHZ25_00620 [Candidatus Pacebacteria bacterium]|nr:hypothetical protein [Candidatus Paceibacterota bacterium]
MLNEERRKVLEEELNDIKEQLTRLEKESTDFGSDVDGGDEESHETEAFNMNLSLKETLKSRLEEIEKELGEN